MESKFKIGDEVACVDREEGCWYDVGDHVIISSEGFIEPYGSCTVYNIEGESKHVWIDEDHFKLYKEGQNKEMVESPSHYDLFPGVEAIQVIASSLTVEEYRGYCLGNLLKYRLRCGKKDNVEQELAKADRYIGLFEEYKHLCKEE